jgi:hypothetical protein
MLHEFPTIPSSPAPRLTCGSEHWLGVKDSSFIPFKLCNDSPLISSFFAARWLFLGIAPRWRRSIPFNSVSFPTHWLQSLVDDLC